MLWVNAHILHWGYLRRDFGWDSSHRTERILNRKLSDGFAGLLRLQSWWHHAALQGLKMSGVHLNSVEGVVKNFFANLAWASRLLNLFRVCRIVFREAQWCNWRVVGSCICLCMSRWKWHHYFFRVDSAWNSVALWQLVVCDCLVAT